MRSVLVIDDSAETLETASLILEEAGYSVVRCGDAGRAADLCGEVNFDLVICDIYMEHKAAGAAKTNLAGLQVIFSIAERFPALPVVAMSGWLDEEGLAKMKTAGVVEVLAKPFSRDKLLEVAARALKKADGTCD